MFRVWKWRTEQANLKKSLKNLKSNRSSRVPLLPLLASLSGCQGTDHDAANPSLKSVENVADNSGLPHRFGLV